MLFQSQIFALVFLPVCVALYYAAARSVAGRQWVLIAASIVFYSWWDPRLVILPLGQIAVTWLLAVGHERTGRRSLLILGIVLNLCVLGTFKYLDFALASLESATGIAFPRAHIILPIGISFFTFQLVSYLADRWRGEAPIYGFRPFALFILLFPQMIAGPIVRHNQLLPQFDLDPWREGMAHRFGLGLVIFTIGLGKKVLLADPIARIVDPLYAQAVQGTLTFGEAWTAALGFSFQLFLDFSSYTEMAIGAALLFGFVLPENFRRPYLAADLRDFWRRWHITLSAFLRDYLYIPLGGSRHGAFRFAVATMITMGLCGLWHGAGWTFVAWGLWHGIGLIACRAWQQLQRPLPGALAWALTMLFVLIGWVLFRADGFGTAGSILASLTGLNGLSGPLQGAGLLAAAALASVLIPSAHEVMNRQIQPRPILAFGGAALAVYCMLQVGLGAPVNFIYFQF